MTWKMYWKENYSCSIHWARFKIRRHLVVKELYSLFSPGLAVARKVYNVQFLAFLEDG